MHHPNLLASRKGQSNYPVRNVRLLFWQRFFMGLLSFLITITSARSQTYSPVTVTGFNADVIANGTVFAGSVTDDVDNSGYYFLNQSFTAFGTPTYYLPNSGLINSVTTAGLTFQLASAAQNNSLRLITANAAGTLSFTVPKKAAVLYLLATSGSDVSTINVVVTFSDATTQTFTGLSISDWYDGTPIAAQGIGRTNATALDATVTATNPRLYQLPLTINAANYTKDITSILITKTSTTGAAQIMGVSASPPCTAPAAQPTALVLTAVSTSQIDGSFTATAADQYLVVRYAAGATPVAPTNAVAYAVGGNLGTGTVVLATNSTAFSVTGLTGSTSYDFYVYGYNATSCIGPVYNTAIPLFGTKATTSCTGPSGIISVGPTGTYGSLTSAFIAVANGISNSVIFELQPTYAGNAEAFPISVSSNGCISSSKTITIRPALGANGLEISTSIAGPTFDFSEASYVTIDGRPGGIGSTIAVSNSGTLNPINLNIINTNIAGVAIRLDNNSSNNKVMYCDIQGQNTTDANVPNLLAGVVYFGNNGVLGNDKNTIDHCNIHAAGTGVNVPSIGVYALGAANNGANTNFNDSDTLSSNNIYDYFLASGNSVGVELNQGVDSWVIKDNHFFQKNTLTFTAATYQRVTWVIPNRNTNSIGNGFQITGNYIGGSAPNAAGTPYTITGQANYFEGIRLEIVDGATANPSSIQGNIITNISQTTTMTTASDAFHGIAINSSNGAVNVGTVTGNMIGSGTATGAINISAGNGSHSIGLFISGTGATYNPNFICSNNTIGGFTLPGAGSSFSGYFNNTYGTATINNNLFGGSVTNSINLSNTSTSASFLKAINVASGNGTFIITNNTIMNMTAASLATGTTVCQVIGVAISGTASSATIRVPTITGNKIMNLYNASAVTGNAGSSAMIGIAMGSTLALATNISGNIIDSLVVGGSASAAVNITGIYINGSSSTNTIAKNNIHSLEVMGTSTSAIITGILANAGAFTVVNNMVRLGYRANGNSITTALTINGIMPAATVTNNYYHNSVYIGGTGVDGTATNTFAFRRFATSGAYDIRDNIFVNNRSNTAGGGKHYAVYFTSSNSGVGLNYNVYQTAGTGGIFGYSGTADVATYGANGWLAADANSYTGDPKFINPTGSAATGNLHISTGSTTFIEGSGVAIASVTDDMDGEARGGLTPTDIGADAGNFLAVASCAVPNAPTALVLTAISSNQINGSFTASAPAADGYFVVRYANGATPVNPVANAAYPVGTALGTGIVIYSGTATTFTSPALLPATTYQYVVYALNSICVNGPKYSVALSGNQITQPCSGPSGNVSVGSTGTFPTLTAALSGIIGGISGPLVFELQSTYVSTGETFPIVLAYNACITPTNNLTIRPATGAVGLAITASNAGPTIDFNGCNYVTIDGRPGSIGTAITVTAAGSRNTNNLNIVNTNAAGSAIRFDNQAAYNDVLFTDLQGQNTVGANVPTTLAGVVYFGNNGAIGSDYNTVDHCNIHSTGTTFPSIGVYALGATNNGLNVNFNERDTISNNNIYDYFLPGGNSVGVELNQGVNNWMVSGNSFFQTTTKTFTAAGYNRALWVVSNRNDGASVGNGFIITNNYIGGSAPLCAGTPYTLTAQANYFDGIRLETADGTIANPSSIQGNTITNIAITSTTTTANDVFHGITVTSSRASVNIGTVAGNTIGSSSAAGAITIAAGSGSHSIPLFISNSNGAGTTIIVKNTIIGGITLPNAGSNFSGIFDNQLGTVSIDSTLIGSTTIANSINASNTSTTSQFVKAINLSSGSGTIAVTNTTIANLNNSSTSTTSGTQTVGLSMGTTPIVPVITGNTIYNLSCAAAQTGGGGSATVGGILYTTTATTSNISGNKIYGLKSTSASTTAAILMEGIFIGGSTTAQISVTRNFVHSFDASANNPALSMRGIEFSSGAGTIVNNMVRLGIQADGSSLASAPTLFGILKGTTGVVKVNYNSVFIGGNVTATTTNASYAFRRAATSGVDDIRNNIFDNERSNVTTGGKHYAFGYSGSITDATLNYNLYGYLGTGGVFANNGTTDIAAYAAAWTPTDIYSVTGNPRFVNATGTAALANLHIDVSLVSPASAAAVVLAAYTTDYDNDVRHATTPDIGADEFDVALPITLGNFWGQKQGAKNLLSWTTVTETNNTGFELQRSVDGNRFSSLAFLATKAANGNSTGLLTYTYSDSKPLVANNYYRLKQIDKDGKSAYSNIVLLKGAEVGSAPIVIVYPNPVVDVINIRINSNDVKKVIFVLYDMNGKTLASQTVLLAAGENIAHFNMAAYAKGSYILNMVDEKGTSVLISKIVK